MSNPITPPAEELRRAIQWLAQLDRVDAKAVEDASVRFDLSPRDEEFLSGNAFNGVWYGDIISSSRHQQEMSCAGSGTISSDER